MQNKKDLAIVMGLTENLTFALANVLQQLKETSPLLLEKTSKIIVYHDNISKKHINILNKIYPCEFIEYKFPIQDISMFNPIFFERFPSIIYSIYECFEHLNDYKQVLWLDVDILIQKEIVKLLDYSKSLAILDFENHISHGQKLYLRNNFLKNIEGYDLDVIAFGTGTVLLNDSLNDFNKIKDWCYKKTYEYAESLILGDQAIINLALQKFNIIPQKLDFVDYACPVKHKNSRNAYIIHPAGRYKFWNFHYNFKKWNKFNKNWIKMGGEPFKGTKFNYFSHYFLIKFPNAPDPTRHTGKFIRYLFNNIKDFINISIADNSR